ncbi:MAG: 3-methyl-2-oxobutanoate dehydrogenase subunit VorB [Marinilabiliales bacterium]|nr:MAG: 3-methyl-2-oxobutanoate dehydrogenase subunit VorB [Marinilabiliales bacterium]
MEKELRLMKGNEAIAEAAIRSGADAYFGYPITPQSEVIEYLMAEKPHERTGMVVLQAESEVAAINMIYGAASCGRMAMTSSSSPGISLKQEGISYIAGAELPCLILNVVRGGPGLGTIQPSQSDYFQSTKCGGHGDYRLIVLAPASVQEMYDFVELGFDLAFKYRNPVMIQSDGIIGQMMEKVEIGEQKQRRDPQDIIKQCPWATTGKPESRERNIITSLDLVAAKQEEFNRKLIRKYEEVKENEVRYELINTEDADYIIVAYGSSSRLSMKAMDILRAKGVKVGIVRLITLFPFPTKVLSELADKVKGFLAVEMSAGQMVEDVQLATKFKVPVEHFGRLGGVIPAPEEIVEALEQKIIGG